MLGKATFLYIKMINDSCLFVRLLFVIFSHFISMFTNKYLNIHPTDLNITISVSTFTHKCLNIYP